jgi:nucleotide-binding universal stress UspA family protein
VLGAHPARARSGTTRLPWSTAHQVIAHATCPVLTVRG